MWDSEWLKNMHWDIPDERVTAQAAAFTREEFSSPHGLLRYRLFKPKYSAKLPLVLYLHGADDRGKDNDYHMTHHENACIFATDISQMRWPCYVLAPQCTEKHFWEQDSMKQRLKALLDDILSRYEGVDPKKLLIFGNSMGGVGTLAMIKEYPGLFARAMAICGSTVNRDLDRIIDIPLLMIHAEDDRIVKPGISHTLTGQEFYGSFALYDTLKARGKQNVWLLKYPAGTLMKDYGINPHCSWFPALREKAVSEFFLGGSEWKLG